MGPVLQKRLAEQFGGLEAAWQATPGDLQRVEGIGPKLAQAIAYQRPQFCPEAALDQEELFLTPADQSYPTLLYEIPDPPPVLYYQGRLDLLSACQASPAIGVVGTRGPSEYGKRWTRRLTTALSQAGFVIISGLADGIDREAHQSCLDVNGETIAVLGTGVDVAYPHRNKSLHQAIAQTGLLVSEHPPGTRPDRVHFPRRNRVIAGLSRAVLVTEAPHQSGALITARLANDYGRDVFVLPGSLDNPRSLGGLELVNQGAHLILNESSLIEILGGIPVATLPPANRYSQTLPSDIAPHLRQVLQAISDEACSLDSIVQQLITLYPKDNLATGDVLSALTQLELMGLVSSLPATQQYQRCSS